MKKSLTLSVLSVVLISGFVYAEKIDNLIIQLKGKDIAAASKAAEILGKSRDIKVVPHLLDIAASASKPDQVRIAAINALSNLRTTKVIKALLEVVKDSSNSTEVRQAAGAIVGKKTNKVIMRMFEIELRSGDNARQVAALQTLGFIGDNGSISLIMPALNDRHLKEEAIKALGYAKNPRATQVLVNLMGSIRYKKLALEALANSNDPAVFDILAPKLIDGKFMSDERKKLLKYIINSGHKDSLKYIVAALDDAFIKSIAIEYLMSSKDPEVFKLMTNILADKEKSLSLRRNALEYLIKSDNPKAKPHVAAAMNDDKLSETVVSAMMKSDDPQAVTIVGQALASGKLARHKHRDAIRFLGDSKDPQAAQYLASSVKGRFTQKEAVQALLKIGGPTIVKPIMPGIASNDGRLAREVYDILVKSDGDWLVPAMVDLLMENPFRSDLVQKLLTTKAKLEHGDKIAELLMSPRNQTDTVQLLKRLRWVPKKTEHKIKYYIATKDWEKCKSIGKPVIEPMLKYINKSSANEPVNVLIEMGASEQVKKVLEEKLLRMVLRKDQAILLKEKLGWEPTILKEKIVYLLAIDDLRGMGKLWKKEPEVKSFFVDQLNGRNASQAVYYSIRLGRKDMVDPIIACLNRLEGGSHGAEVIANTLLNCGNDKLEKAAMDWGKRNGYTIEKTNYDSGGSKWGK